MDGARFCPSLGFNCEAAPGPAAINASLNPSVRKQDPYRVDPCRVGRIEHDVGDVIQSGRRECLTAIPAHEGCPDRSDRRGVYLTDRGRGPAPCRPMRAIDLPPGLASVATLQKRKKIPTCPKHVRVLRIHGQSGRTTEDPRFPLRKDTKTVEPAGTPILAPKNSPSAPRVEPSRLARGDRQRDKFRPSGSLARPTVDSREGGRGSEDPASDQPRRKSAEQGPRQRILEGHLSILRVPDRLR